MRASENSFSENTERNRSHFRQTAGFDASEPTLSSVHGNLDRLRYPDNATAKAVLPAIDIYGMAGPGAEAFLCRANGEAPTDEKARKEVHDIITSNAERLVGDLNSSNKMEQAPRAVAESTLRVLSIGLWGGTGISQHKNWQEREPRKAVISPGQDKDGKVAVGPDQWAACFKDVQEYKDSLDRKWANCAEQAASAAHMVYAMVINNKDLPAASGMQVRQCYQGNHSWIEVKDADGIKVYDPWSKLTGKLEDMPARYRDGVKHSQWYGKK